MRENEHHSPALSPEVQQIINGLGLEPQDLLSHEPLWNEEQVRRFLDLRSKRGVQGWRMRGVGPPHLRLSGNTIRYIPAVVRAWAATRLRASTAEPDPENETA